MNTLESIEVTGQGSFKDLYILLKPRVMWLAVFTAAVGMIIAPVQNNFFSIFDHIVVYFNRSWRCRGVKHVVG